MIPPFLPSGNVRQTPFSVHFGLSKYRALARDVSVLTKSVFIRVFLVKPLKTCGKKVVCSTAIAETHNSCKLFFWYVSHHTSTNTIADSYVNYRHIPGAFHGCRYHTIMFFCHTEILNRHFLMQLFSIAKYNYAFYARSVSGADLENSQGGNRELVKGWGSIGMGVAIYSMVGSTVD